MCHLNVATKINLVHYGFLI